MGWCDSDTAFMNEQQGTVGNQSGAGGTPPAGWYYAQGDPVGTTRYWDGAQWTGEPVAQAQQAVPTQQAVPAQPQPLGSFDDSFGISYGQPRATAQRQATTNPTFPGAPGPYDPTAAGAGYQASSVVELSPLGYWKKCWKDWSKFDGRARRAEYWYFYLINVGISIVLQILTSVSEIFILAYLLFIVVAVIPTLAAGSRRMHDTNHSGWWYIVPIVTLIFACMDGDRGPNSRGPSPKYEQYSTMTPPARGAAISEFSSY